MADEVATTGVPAVNVIPRSRVVDGAMISGSPAGARREVRVSGATSEAVGSTGKGRVATTAKVRTATTGDVATATAAASVSATTTAATVTLGTGHHRGTGGNRYSGQYTEGPGENSCMFRVHGFHSVAEPRWSPRGIRTLQRIRRFVTAFVQVRFLTACIWLRRNLFSSLGVPDGVPRLLIHNAIPPGPMTAGALS
jgi:hypothetical protein